MGRGVSLPAQRDPMLVLAEAMRAGGGHGLELVARATRQGARVRFWMPTRRSAEPLAAIWRSAGWQGRVHPHYDLVAGEDGVQVVVDLPLALDPEHPALARTAPPAIGPPPSQDEVDLQP